MAEALLVRDIMSFDAYHVTPDTPIAELVMELIRHRLPGAPVADGNGRLIGFVSEQDVLPQLLQSYYYCQQPPEVEKAMCKDVLTVGPNEPVMNIAKMMMEAKPKIYPVVEDGRLIGVVTRSQVTKALLTAQKGCKPV